MGASRKLSLSAIRSGSAKCHYCGSKVFVRGTPEAIANPARVATKDHVLPQLFRTLNDNQVDHSDNIVTACSQCNNVKSGYPVEPFVFFMESTRGTALFNPVEFKKFVFGLTLAGFRTAKRDALARRSKPLPPRTPQGRFTKRDLQRGR